MLVHVYGDDVYMTFKQMHIKLLLCLVKHNVKHNRLDWW